LQKNKKIIKISIKHIIIIKIKEDKMMIERKENEKIRVAVHDGAFHPDDVLCVTMLAHVYGLENLEIIRTRNEELLKTCHYICDVGNKDLVTKNQVWFDHHKKPKNTYENGVEKAACGKLAEYLFSDNKKLLEQMQKSFLYSLEASDNGQDLADFNLKPCVFDFISHMNATWDEDLEEVGNERFMLAVTNTLNVFKSEIRNFRANDLAIEHLNKCLKEYDKTEGILRTGKLSSKFGNFIVKANEEGYGISAVLCIGYDGNYNVWSVQKKLDTFPVGRLPQEWAGLKDDELKEACSKYLGKNNSAVFCFAPLNFFVCKDKKDAEIVAKMIVERDRQIEKENCER